MNTQAVRNQAILSLLLSGLLLSLLTPSSDAIWPFHKKKTQKTTEQPVATESTELGEATTSPNDTVSTEPETQPQAADVIPKPYVEAEPKVEVRSPLSTEGGLTVEEPINSPDAPPQKIYVTVDDPKNPLGITTSAQTLERVTKLIEEKKYAQAHVELDPLLNWLVDSTEAHISLNKTLTRIPSARVQAELEKQLALQFALLRDKAFFNKALVALGEKKNGEAVKSLSKVIQSQPRSAMGLKSYELLQSMGFTEKIQVEEAAGN